LENGNRTLHRRACYDRERPVVETAVAESEPGRERCRLGNDGTRNYVRVAFPTGARTVTDAKRARYRQR